MALTATTYFEVQTTGSDTNGGGFDSAASGTDYTYGAGQTTIAYTDLVIQATTTQVASVGRPFVAADVGNIINITAGTGFTVQRVQIASVAGGIATGEKSFGTAASSGGTGTLGGALASPGMAASLMVNGSRMYVKAGTYTIGNSGANTSGGVVSLTATGTGTSQPLVQGYQTTRGDGGTMPILMNSGNTATSIFTFTGAMLVDNIAIDGNSGATMTGFSGAASGRLIRCKASNCPTAGFASSASMTFYHFCEATGCGIGFNGRSTAFKCVSHGNTTGFTMSGGGCFIDGCITYGNTGVGFSDSGGIMCPFNKCTAYNNGSHGFNLGGGTTILMSAFECVSYGNGGNDFNWNTEVLNFMRGCAYGTIAGTVTQEVCVTLTANPFTNAGGNDFTLNNVSGGGNLARASSNSIFLGTSTTSYGDMGATQHQEIPASMITE